MKILKKVPLFNLPWLQLSSRKRLWMLCKKEGFFRIGLQKKKGQSNCWDWDLYPWLSMVTYFRVEISPPYAIWRCLERLIDNVHMAPIQYIKYKSKILHEKAEKKSKEMGLGRSLGVDSGADLGVTERTDEIGGLRTQDSTYHRCSSCHDYCSSWKYHTYEKSTWESQRLQSTYEVPNWLALCIYIFVNETLCM